VILLLLLFRSSRKTQENNIIQSEKKIDSIEKQIIQTKSEIIKYEEVKIDFIDTFQRNDIEDFFAKRYNNKNSN
jgi:L-lysine 2,3-aminomutase